MNCAILLALDPACRRSELPNTSVRSSTCCAWTESSQTTVAIRSQMSSRRLTPPSNPVWRADDIRLSRKRAELIVASQWCASSRVRVGSWPCEDAGGCGAVQWRSQASDVLSFSREARLLAAGDAEAQKSREFRGTYSSGARLTSCNSCFYVSSPG